MKLTPPSYEFVLFGEFSEVVPAVDWAFKNCKGHVGIQFCARDTLPVSPLLPHQLVVFNTDTATSIGFAFDNVDDATVFRTFWGSN